MTRPTAETKRRTIFVDALSAIEGGGQTYLINLFKHFPPDLRDRVRVVALIPHGADRLRVDGDIEYLQSAFASGGLVPRLIWSRLWLRRLLKSLSVDVLYCPGGFVSAFGGPWRTAVAFRNMLPFTDEARRRYPLGYTRTRLLLLRWIQARSFKRADAVIFISEFAKSIIDISVGPRRGTSTVIPHGIADEFRRPPSRRASSLPDRYVAYVSVVTVYKAQVEVVRAWAMMRARRACPEKLLLVGPAYGPYARQVRAVIAELGLTDAVIMMGDVPNEDLPAIYQGAAVNIFASSCENCPNILLEALASARPVVCSDYQPMPEFAGDAAVYFDPYNPATLADQLCQLLDDDESRAEMGRRSEQRSARFQWRRSADRTWRTLAALGGLPAASAPCVE